MATIVESSTQYRAHCQDCHKRFSWHDTVEEPEAEANAHQAVRDHIVDIDEKMMRLRLLKVRRRRN